ncbi:unnamed protein product [Phytomonas sp. EM1]|nr:unnamed protein product [Phytomonas sp. EM1]|eukprot:CCW63900.1 unnamed protein product [Phytomonas sp. isolate EM1]
MSHFFPGLNSEPCVQSGANLMGSLRCLFDRHSRTRLSGYKKRFWVVNTAYNRLEVYKNDQAHTWQHVVWARDIRNVVYARDKQNRFYMMILQTRNNHNIRFRMDSSEEREEWYNAITKLMDAYSTTNRLVNILHMADRQCRLMSYKLKVRINVEATLLISKMLQNVFQYVLEAVDAAIANIAVVVRTYGADMEAPLSYTLFVDVCTSDRDRVSKGPCYDPIKRRMVMNVALYHHAPGSVNFSVTSAEEVLQLLQSDVFRNPLVEGWITNLPGCAAICQSIRDTLKTKSLGFTLNWGLNFKNNANTEAYLQSFVNLDFFKAIYYDVKEALNDVMQLLMEDGFSAESAGMFSDLLNPVHSSFMIKQRQRNMESKLHSDGKSTSNSKQIASPILNSGLTGGPLVCDDELFKLAISNCAAGLISKNITGVAIVLEEKMVHECKCPPQLCVEHTLEYGQRLRSVFVLLSEYRRVFSKSLSDFSYGVPLKSQLFQVALHDLLYRKVMTLRSKMSQMFNKRISVVIEWDQFLNALKAIGIDLALKDFLSLLNGISTFYLPRLQKVVGVLKRTPDVILSGISNDVSTSTAHPRSSLFEVFCQCVSSIHVNFLSFKELKAGQTIPEPRVVDGLLVDTLVCVKSDALLSLSETIKKSQLQLQGQSLTCVSVAELDALNLLNDVQVCALTANLGAWCASYFSVEEHYVPLRRDAFTLREDEFEGCSDTCVAHEPIPELNYGEMVANERSSEIQLFNLRRVVNTVYDSQGDHVNLKIGTSNIIQAIRSLSAAFRGKRIMKHDLLRVLVVNLHRLRELYSNAVDRKTDMLLSEDKSELVLKNFCEYEESEEDILFFLRDGTEPHPGPQSIPSSIYYKYMSISLGKVPFGDRDLEYRCPDSYNRNIVNSPYSTTRPADVFSASAISSPVKYHDDNINRGGKPVPNDDRNRGQGSRNAQSQLYTENKYNFPTICHVALNYLLPREALLASKAWRTGFVFGLENVGKSLIINSLSGLVLPTVATIGLSQHVVSFKEWVFSLHELGGRESFRENWMYYRKNMKEVNFLFFVMDCMNSHTFGDAYRYLKSVTDYYNKIPLVIIFNNFQDLPRRLTNSELNMRINLNEISMANPNRTIITANCNITVVHSSFRTIPMSLQTALKELSDVLLASCPEHLKPSIPKVPPEGQASFSSPDYLVDGYGMVLDFAGNVLRTR